MAYIGKVPADVLIDPMVDSAAITDATIVTADIANDAITSAKLAADSVDSSELIDGSVDNAHLAGSIATTKLTGALTSVGSHGLATSATTDTTNASNISSGTLAAARVATLNQNTTGSAATVSTAAQTSITSVGTLTGLTVNSAITLGVSGSTNGKISAPEALYFNIDSDGTQTDTEFVWGTNRTGDSGGTEIMRLTESGYLGIGIEPTQPLHVAKSFNGDYAALIHNTHATGGQGLMIRAGDGADETVLSIRNQASGALVTFLADGNVGIGTSAPLATLSVAQAFDAATDAGIGFYSSSNANYRNYISSNLSGSANASVMHFYVNQSSATETQVMTLKGDGNVGIGTASPATKLDITQSSFSASAALRINNPSHNEHWDLAISNNSGTLLELSNYNSGTTMVWNNGGNVGIGTSSPQRILDVKGTSDQPVDGIFRVLGTSEYAIEMGVHDASPWGTWIQSGYYVNGAGTYTSAGPLNLNPSGGNVGIGTTAPLANMDVADATDPRIRLTRADSTTGSGDLLGSIQFAADDPSAGAVGASIQAKSMSEWSANDYGAYVRMMLTYNGTGDQHETFRFTSDGGSAKLDCIGRNDGSNSYLRFADNGNSVDGGDQIFKFHADGGNMRLYIVDNNSTLTYLSQDSTSWEGFSDSRWKKNVSTISGGLDKINALRGVNYKWNAASERSDTTTNRVGFIAQEVKDIIPEAVGEAESPSHNDDKLYYSIRDSALIPFLVEAVKELSAKVTELENA